MEDMTKVVLDAMGGDNAPGEIVKGAVDALAREAGLHIILVGRREDIERELAKYSYDKSRMEIVHAEEVIETAEPPVNAIRKKKDSSIVVGMKMVKEGQADAFVSAGSSGAILVGGQVIVGRIKGVERPPLAPLIPTEKGVKETFPLLKEEKSIHFIGSVEAREIPSGQADVIVCEAFAGNIILKLFEGVGNTLIREIKGGMMKNLRSKIGALLVKPALKETLKKFDTAEHGGAPLLGLNGLVVKTHGRSKSKEISNTLVQCVTFKKQKINEKIRESIQAE